MFPLLLQRLLDHTHAWLLEILRVRVPNVFVCKHTIRGGQHCDSCHSCAFLRRTASGHATMKGQTRRWMLSIDTILALKRDQRFRLRNCNIYLLVSLSNWHSFPFRYHLLMKEQTTTSHNVGVMAARQLPAMSCWYKNCNAPLGPITH